jgi:hypothetical protein
MANWIQVLEKQPSNQPCFPNKFKLKAFQKIFQPKIADRTQTATHTYNCAACTYRPIIGLDKADF